ncbi:hypothetical protein BDN72DRAFT_841321 [Pluteus cervinus]|uniref:Uncharacterized protein n=1 Tax=Pluteus cervinus TaxID=181527 RepID=A0ACD3ASA6_9AGAR|nr:hypothetical protein BDN72DRAFT_841321 [Pluteus cervinus]
MTPKLKRSHGHPIHGVPDEVLAEIFLQVPVSRWTTYWDSSSLATLSDYYRQPPRPCCFKRSPLVFAHVCHRWRAIVFTTPKLWSYFPIVDMGEDNNPFLKTFLKYSKRTPLSIYGLGHYGAGRRTADALMQKAEQWEEITFYNCNHFLDLGELRGRLRSLRVARLLDDYGHDPMFPHDLFADAPVLEELTLVTSDYRQPLTQLPPTVRKYHGNYRGARDALTLLERNPQLVFCRLDAEDPRTTHPDQWDPAGQYHEVTMPNLKTLQLVGCEPGFEDDVFMNYIILPQLENLTLHITGQVRPYRYPDLISMVQRSGCSLRKLSLTVKENTYPSTEILSTLFKATPDLEEFSLYSQSVSLSDNEVLAILKDHTLVPKLTTLTIDSFDHWVPDGKKALDPHLIKEVVRARARAVNEYGQLEGPSPKGQLRSLNYLSLKRSNIDEDIQATFAGWSTKQDSDYEPLLAHCQQLKKVFMRPAHERDRNHLASIVESMSYVIQNHRDLNVAAVLSSGIHLVLLKLILRGSSPGFEIIPRFESAWITKITPVVEYWKSQTKEYLKTPRWLAYGHRFYWVGGDRLEKSNDVYEDFWNLADPSGHPARRSYRSLPRHLFNPHTLALSVPDWERIGLLNCPLKHTWPKSGGPSVSKKLNYAKHLPCKFWYLCAVVVAS